MDDFEPGGANRSFEPSIPNGLRKTCQEGKFPMSICKAIFFATIFSPMLICAAQTAVGGPATSVTPPASNVFTPAPPSEILKPALQEVLQTVGAVNLDKWKKGSVRDEAGKNIDAIQRYMHGTMPQLIVEGDAAPGTLSKVLPVSVNVDRIAWQVARFSSSRRAIWVALSRSSGSRASRLRMRTTRWVGGDEATNHSRVGAGRHRGEA